MGVNVFGDIAMLKHLKIYPKKVARKRILNVMGRETSIQKATRGALLKENSVKSVTSLIAKPGPVAQFVSVSPPQKQRIGGLTVTIKHVINHGNYSMDTNKGIESKRKVILSSLLPLTSTSVALPKVSVNAVNAACKKYADFQRSSESNMSSTTPESSKIISKSYRLSGMEADILSLPMVKQKDTHPHSSLRGIP